MPDVTLRLADEFVESLAGIYSTRLLERIKSLVTSIATFPELGSPMVRKSLVARYGDKLRHIAVAQFVIVYRYADNVLDVLALVYGPRII